MRHRWVRSASRPEHCSVCGVIRRVTRGPFRGVSMVYRWPDGRTQTVSESDRKPPCEGPPAVKEAA